MSGNDSQKADSIAFHFYTKFFYVVNHARATAEPRVTPKVDKWFNLETPDSDLFTKDAKDPYRSISTSPPPPPLELQVLLTIPELTHNQVLVHLAPDSSRVRVDPTPRHILLEKWVLAFMPRIRTDRNRRRGEDEGDEEVALPTIYKHGIPLFRSLYALLRILPAWKLYKRLRSRIVGSNRNGQFSIHIRVRDNASDILDFGAPLASAHPPLPTETHTFPSVPLTMGSLTLTTTHLISPNFQLDELESLLSSRFLSLDADAGEFLPTLARHQQRDSISGTGGSPGSLPIRISLPMSPPNATRDVDRFVLPSRHAAASSSVSGSGAGAGTEASPRTVPLPIGRQPSASGGGGSSIGSSSSTSACDNPHNPNTNNTVGSSGRQISGLAARLRKESTGSSRVGGIGSLSNLGSSADLPSVPFPSNPPAPLPIRRPNINPVHPFKSSTLSLSSSPSGRPSSLSGGRIQTSPIAAGGARVPLSPIGMATRPSPPFAPSSLGAASMAGGDDGAADAGAGRGARKRYSSSFSHRYTASASGTGGAGSEGSASIGSTGEKPGAGVRRESAGERGTNALFLSTNTDDDDISVFVQDIDTRKPLSGRVNQEKEREREREQRRTSVAQGGVGNEGEQVAEVPEDDHGRRGGQGMVITTGPAHGSGGAGGGVGAASPPGAMLTTESEVDERLRRMNEAFLASLQGLGGSGEGGSLRRRERREREGVGLTGTRRSRNGSRGSGDGVSQGGSEEIIGRLEVGD